MKIVILGQGGQGAIYLSRLISDLFKSDKILSSEIHGMAKKGGLVEIHLKIGDYKSPIIGYNKADLVILLNDEYKKLAFFYSNNIMSLDDKEVGYLISRNPKMINIFMFGKLVKLLRIDKEKAECKLSSTEKVFFNKGFDNDF